jgi:hypothetical protein
MTRRGVAAAGVLGVVALVLAIIVVARLSARSAKGPGILVSSPAHSPASPPASTGSLATAGHCDIGGSSPGPSALRMGGACGGQLTEAFGCVSAVDDLYLTGRQRVDATHILYLTVNVESYHQRPGDYGGAQAVVQLTGPTTVERWSDYSVGVHVNPDGSVRVPPSDLAADPGTGSDGDITISGSIGCGAT